MPTFRAGFALPLDELRDELDRFWTTLTAAPPLHGWGAGPRAGLFPAVNVRETDDAVTVEAELPGLDTADVEISVAGVELVLKGARPLAAAEPGNGTQKPVTWQRRERGSGSFERRLVLPVAIDAHRVEAHLVDGVLTMRCPKAAECQPHKIEVRTA
jgi:HSP20 family protein